ncbi:IPT/TIG domain-containing protein [Pontibacter sp. HSC-14F20]|uniref:IPT/TIG domain-containing protein n=1 Tax=Pontibacter sp. HSC-14F20 TaxID=2864136 RepID=UPI001C732D11|nr:IPT/TIG domain-containing protein [Pontibacter sp. HSC-14F20]MBX0334334.1 IPT/TIG domain-containing protein [Pontibacter sp. HSC-14F20]
MAQLYNPPLGRLIRTLLLQCMIMLGIVSTGVAQATLPINYDGPWGDELPQGWSKTGTIITGQDLEGGSQGSAQFRGASATIGISIANASTTDFRLRYSLQAITTRSGYSASFTVSYSTDGGTSYTPTASADAITPARTAQRLTDLLPAATTNIRFTLNSVSEAYVLLDAIELVQTPEVLTATPASGVPGTAITITGNRLNNATVKFGEIVVPAELTIKDAAGVESTVNGVTINATGTEIIAYVPYGAIANSPITVNTTYGTTAPVDFTVPAPEFDATTPFSRASGIAGETVLLKGNNFIDASAVLFNGVAAAFTVDHNGQITATIPALASSGPITVTTPAGSVNSVSFTVPGPVVSSFAPAASEGPGTEITISGEYFNGVTDVKFNGVTATGFTVNQTNDEITVNVPLGASTGPITVTSPAGTGTSETPFEVPAPKFVAKTIGELNLEFDPARTGAGKTITIYGENLASVSRVVFAAAEGEGADGTNLVATTDTALTVTVPAGAANGTLQLIAPGNKIANSSQIFEFVPAPSIATVTPIYGEVETEITITGTNFQEADSVKIGDGTVLAADFEVNAEGTVITLSIPTDATTGTVSVTTLLGGTGVWNGTFDVVLAPAITAFTPAEGPIGQEITLTGTNLKYVTEVVFLGDNNTEEESDTRVTLTAPNDSETQLVFNVPTGTPAGSGKLLVRNSVDAAVSAEDFEVILHPVAQSITPTMGVIASTVKIEGYNFENATSLSFGGVVIPAATQSTEGFTIDSDKLITVTVPAEAAVISPIIITNGFGDSEPVNFTVIKTPTIDSFVAERGIIGSEVVITGTNFYGENITVSFAGAEGRVVAPARDITPTQLKVTVPTGAITGNLTVTNVAGPSEPSETDYIVATKPEIFSFTPTSGKVGDDVVITGWLMQNVTEVAFNGVRTAVTPSADGDTIKVKVPDGATTGRLSLFEGENSVFTTAENEIFTVILAPTIIVVSPDRGVEGTVVTITGTNFIEVTSVTFNGGNEVVVEGENIEVNETFDVLTVTVPTGAKTGDLVVTTEAGTANFEDFVVPTPAAITFTNNTTTPFVSYANQSVTIRGQYFTGATEVDFNGKKITTGITVVDAEGEDSTNPERFQLITVKAPFDAGKGKITVTTPAGSGISADDYTVIEPKIASISATEGYAAQTVLTITGELFTQYWNETLNGGEEDVKAPIVKFNGAQIEATTYTANGTSITVTVPGSARTGSVTVVSGSGESEPVQFNVLAPVLSSLSPTAVYASQSVTISGTNFINVTGMSYGNIPITGYNIVLTDSVKGTGTITFVAPVIDHNTTNTLSVTSTSGTGSREFTIYRPVISNVFETGKESLADRRIYAGVNTITIKGTRFDEYWNGAVTTATPTMSLVRTNSTTATPIEIIGFTFNAGENEEGVDEIVATIPTTIPAGDYFVRVTSRSGAGQSSGPAGTITVLGTPTIVSLSKAVGLVGDKFTITGTFFDDASKVTFLGIEGEADEVDAVFERTSTTELLVTVPVAAKIGKIAVTTPFNGGVGTTVISEDIFRVVKAPIVYDFNTKTGPSGSIVTITGENLIAVDGRIKVSFKGHGGEIIPAELVDQAELNATVTAEDLVTARTIAVRVPVNAITGVITLANEVGTVTTAEARDTNVDVYTVTSPVVIRFEKTNGSRIAVGNHARLLETVIVKGYNLVGVQRLRIGSTNVFGYYEDNQHTLEMIVPRTADREIVNVITGVGSDASEEMLEIIKPDITVDPTVLSFKAAVESEEVTTYDVKSYTVTATNLAVGQTLLISLSENMPYLLSLDPNSTAEDAWTTGMTLSAGENGNLTQVVYARNNSTAVANDESSRQTVLANHSSLEATTRTVTLQAEIIPLPVELISFNARKEGNGVQLTWATASELDNDYFEVQMTEDLKGEFKAVGKVKSKVNTTSLRQDYQFNHKGNFNGTRYYRLKQVDLDGTSDYSKVVAVSSNGVNLAVGPRVYPNPINAESKLVYNADRAGKLNVRIVNMNGSAVQSLSYDIEEGENTILLNLNNNLPTGIYILMTEFNGKMEQVKLMKQ